MGIKPTTVFFLSYWIALTAFAQTHVLKKTYNFRNDDKNFITSSNIVGQISEGSEVEVLSKKTLNSGATAIKIKVINPGYGSSDKLTAGDEVYVYQPPRTTAVKPVEIDSKSSMEAGISDTCVGCSASAMGSQTAVSTSQKLLAALEQQADSVKDAVPAASSNYQEMIQKYENSPQVEKAVKWAAVSIGRLKGGGKCYRGTKLILAKGQLIDNARYPDKYARDAVNTLPSMGFVNLLNQPYNLKLTPDTAPKGAVLVYESALACDKSTRNIMGQGCGHIEVKLGDGKKTKGYKFASDYKSENSILDGATGNKYRLIGVMIKPEP